MLNARLSISSHREIKRFPVGSGREAELPHSLPSPGALSMPLSIPSTALPQPCQGAGQAAQPDGLEPRATFGEEEEDRDEQVIHARALITWGVEMNEPTLPT